MHIFPIKCPYRQPKAINFTMIGVMLMQNGHVIKKTWILLDTCSTNIMTNNLDYIEFMKNWAKHKELTVLTNVVSLLFDWKVSLTF